VIAIDSLTITGNTFSVHKAVDSTSPALSSALVSAHDFSSASLLLYSSIATETQPDFALVFDHALISSIASDSSGERLSETVSFEAARSSVLAPEPELWSALGAAAALLAAGRLRRASAQRRWN